MRVRRRTLVLPTSQVRPCARSTGPGHRRVVWASSYSLQCLPSGDGDSGRDRSWASDDKMALPVMNSEFRLHVLFQIPGFRVQGTQAGSARFPPVSSNGLTLEMALVMPNDPPIRELE